MSSPTDPVSPIADAAKEIVKPVYEDLLQPSTKEIGRTLHGVVRTVLRPVNGVVWAVDRASDWLEHAVTGLLESRGVPTERVIAPRPQILFGVVRGVQATGPEPESGLREMYANLLATAMDRETANVAHPAFAEILHQMLPDEARIIKLLGMHRERVLVEVSAEAWRYAGTGLPALGHRETESFDRHLVSLGGEAACDQPALVDSYVDNLRRLGLITDEHAKAEGHHKEFSVDSKPEVEQLLSWLANYEHAEVSKFMNDFHSFQDRSPRVVMWKLESRFISLTSFGKQFVTACSAA